MMIDAHESPPHEREHLGVFQIFLLGLSVYVLLALLAEVTLPLSNATRRVLMHADTVICVIFLYDFFHRLLRANSKWCYMKWGWIDFISSIPAFPFLRIGRAVRVVRILRLLRGVRSVKTIETVLLANRAQGTLAAAIFTCTLMVVFSSIAILHVETDSSSSNIKSAEDALWWSVATVTTVGYGDRFPVTTEGRVIGALLMVAGVGLFAILAASVAAWFLTPVESDSESKTALKLDAMAAELNLIRISLERLRRASRDEDEILRG